MVNYSLIPATAGALLLLSGLLMLDAWASNARDEPVAAVAREARQVIAVIDWFYVQHRACPLPSRPEDLADLQSGLGDGYSAEGSGRFVAIRGISMAAEWRYYASPAHPDRCTLWRQLGGAPIIAWRRHGGSTAWAVNPGDGGPEQKLRFAPRQATQ